MLKYRGKPRKRGQLRQYRTEQERNEHSLIHWTTIPYFCGVCHKKAFSLELIEKHFSQSHANMPLNIKVSGPTVNKELKAADDSHLAAVRKEVGSDVVIPSISSGKEKDICDILTPSVSLVDESSGSSLAGSKSPVQAEDPLNQNDEEILEVCDNPATNLETEVAVPVGPEDLFIVSSMDTNVPQEGDVYCCEYCPAMSNSEMAIISHITGFHDHMHIKFKVLNSIICENRVDEYVGCGLCSEIGSEMKIRRHYLEKHSGQAFNTFRYTCTYCDKKFLKLHGVKTHSLRTHVGMPLRITDVRQSKLNCVVKEKPKEKQRNANVPLMRYKCPLCRYERIFPASQIAAVKSHLRIHFKAYVCGSCNSRFRGRHDAVTHFTKEHPNIPEVITQDVEVERELNNVVTDIQSSAWVVSTPSPVPSPGPNPLPSTSSRIVARKSTSAVQEPLEEYTFYGLPAEETDLTKINTAVELNGMCLNMSADKLGKIFDLHPYVEVEDCSKTMDLSNYLDS